LIPQFIESTEVQNITDYTNLDHELGTSIVLRRDPFSFTLHNKLNLMNKFTIDICNYHHISIVQLAWVDNTAVEAEKDHESIIGFDERSNCNNDYHSATELLIDLLRVD
jgi:hypothetical protein